MFSPIELSDTMVSSQKVGATLPNPKGFQNL
jgi:hypothetical protein